MILRKLSLFCVLATVALAGINDNKFFIFVRSASSGLDGKYLEPVDKYTDKGKLAIVNGKPKYPFELSKDSLIYTEPGIVPWVAKFFNSSRNHQDELHFISGDQGDGGFTWNSELNLEFDHNGNWYGCNYTGQDNQFTSNVELYSPDETPCDNSYYPLVFEREDII